MSWITVRVRLSITHKPLPQLVFADVPSNRKGPAKDSGWPRHHFLQCDRCDEDAVQSFRSNTVRKGQKEEKTLAFGLGVVYGFFFLASSEGQEFPPTYDKPGDHGLPEGFLHDGEDEASSFPLHCVDQHSLCRSWDVLVNRDPFAQTVSSWPSREYASFLRVLPIPRNPCGSWTRDAHSGSRGC